MGKSKSYIPKCNIRGGYILIFVCVGSREYQFDRLLKEVDELVEQGKLNNEIFAQIGQSTYTPENYKHKRFLSNEEFIEYQKKAQLIISHGGTGALINALKMGKKVISVPRLEKFNEHIDDHQTQIVEVLQNEGYLDSVIDIKDLYKTILKVESSNVEIKYKKESKVLSIIEDFINLS